MTRCANNSVLLVSKAEISTNKLQCFDRKVNLKRQDFQLNNVSVVQEKF